MATEHLTVGGGCFWCLEAVFEMIPGVSSVVSGYAGGARPSPSYAQVCSGATGHAEVIQVAFDPAVVSRRHLLKYFFAFHDPTTLNRQGPDHGTQYRSIILTETAAEAAEAKEVVAVLEAEGVFPDPIVTEIVHLERFWPAEPEHQGYFRKHPTQGYCSVMIAPKVAKLRRSLSE